MDKTDSTGANSRTLTADLCTSVSKRNFYFFNYDGFGKLYDAFVIKEMPTKEGAIEGAIECAFQCTFQHLLPENMESGITVFIPAEEVPFRASVITLHSNGIWISCQGESIFLSYQPHYIPSDMVRFVITTCARWAKESRSTEAVSFLSHVAIENCIQCASGLFTSSDQPTLHNHTFAQIKLKDLIKA
jgi:hypothetical protein